MKTSNVSCRRDFLKTSLLGGLAAATIGRLAAPAAAVEAGASAPKSRVALRAGDDRANNVFQGLAAFRDEIGRAIGDRPVVIKPNNVSIEIQLSATHADCLEGILEFLKSIDKLENVVIAESAANGPALEGFANYGYPRLAEKYGVKLVDLDQAATETVYVFDQEDFRPHAVRMSQLLLNPKSFIISAAMPKTHDRVLATLSLKNVVFGAPVKDPGFRGGRRRVPGKISQKPIVHGSGVYGINYNLFTLAQRLHPDLAVIDGFAGMEGNGPTGGTPVDHRVAVVSPDWLAADRVTAELMGIELSKIGYLTYCAGAKMGETDLERIEIVGDPIARHVRHYKLHKSAEKQLAWMTPPERT